MTEDERARLERARTAYERGTFFGDDDAVDAATQELARAEEEGQLSPAGLLEYGKLLHARSLAQGAEEPRERLVLGRALAGFQAAADVRGEAEARFWQGLCLQLFDQDHDAAQPLLRTSYELSLQVGDALTRSYGARHLGFVAASRERTDEARGLLEESLELRRTLGDFPAGEAAALLALGELEREAGNTARADELLDGADAIATRIGARRVQQWIAAARRGSI